MNHLEIAQQLFFSLLLVAGFFISLTLTPKEAFWEGFFIGIFWFYWVALSFRYYDLEWMIPFVIIAVALIYGVIFLIGYKIASLPPKAFHPLFKALFWLLISYIHPFGFNWFVPDMLLTDLGIIPDKLHFALFLSSIATLYLPKWFKLLALIMPLAFYPQPTPNSIAPLNIKLVTTHLPQQIKWDPAYRDRIITKNLSYIQDAIEQRYDMVVLPESAFPLFLNRHKDLLEKLQNLSQSIAIVTGALYQQDGHYFNSTYLIHKKRVNIFHKVVLVPFGEEIPLPAPIAKWINHLFFNDSSDFTAAKQPYTFQVDGVWFTNAICYEATHPLIYQTSTPFIIAISNNAWFTPSIEPTLQWMLLRYYATIHHKTIYHATNIAKTAIIR